MEWFEKKITKLTNDAAAMQNGKTDQSALEEIVLDLENKIYAVEKRSYQNQSDCGRIESFLEDYMNIKIQNIVASTLRASLTGIQRRNHEKYDQEKMQLLYKNIIDKKGEAGNL